MSLRNEQIDASPPDCPECGASSMIWLPGGGWDYDRWICGRRGCSGEVDADEAEREDDE